MAREVVAAQVFLLDDQQVDSLFARLLADFFGLFHIGGKHLAVHVEAVVNRLRFVNQLFCRRDRHELGEVGLSQLVDEVELAVGEEAGAADTAEDVAGTAFDAAGIFDGALPLERAPCLSR